MSSAISDIGAKIYILETGSYDYLFGVSEIGEIGGSVDKHESTCLDDLVKTYVIGRRDSNEIEFTYNYTEANAVRSKGYFDGTTERTLAIVYGDGSGYEVVGIGTDTSSALSTNSLQKASFTFVQTAIETHLGKTAMDSLLLAPYDSTVATPTCEPDGGAVTENAEITLTCATEGSAIYYTMDGTTPTKSSLLYSGSSKPKITVDCTVKAIGTKTGSNHSVVMSKEFTIAS